LRAPAQRQATPLIGITTPTRLEEANAGRADGHEKVSLSRHYRKANLTLRLNAKG
jgi:hypothetical protein